MRVYVPSDEGGRYAGYYVIATLREYGTAGLGLYQLEHQQQVVAWASEIMETEHRYD